MSQSKIISEESARARRSALSDLLFPRIILIIALSTVALIAGIAITLYLNSRQNFSHSGFSFFTGRLWIPNPPTAVKKLGNIFGVLPFVYGTFVTSAIALFLAVPVGIGSAIFLAEIAPKRISVPISFFIEMLAAVPSIVYGYWALLFLVPRLQNSIEPWLNHYFGRIPLFAMPVDAGYGMDIFAAGLVLAMMILPYITAVSRDVLAATPSEQRESSLGLGATKWETVKSVVLRYAGSGIIGSVMLALGRAIGETMAVTLVIGSKVNLPHLHDYSSFSLFRPGYTMTSVLVDQYTGPNSPLHASALTEIALSLFVITILVNAAARGLVWLTSAKSGSETVVHFRSIILSAFRMIGLGLLIPALVYQSVTDIKMKGLTGLFGPAEIIGLILIAIWVINRSVLATPLFPRWRKLGSFFGLAISFCSTMAAIAALLSLFGFVFQQGLPALNASFFRIPNPSDPAAGGMLHAIVGTAELALLASLFGVPIGVLGGIYLAEFGNGRLGFWVRFCTDLLNGVPSIVVGIFAFGLIVAPTHSNSGYAGAFALGALMIPTVMRTSEELIRLVPRSLREGSLALGATYAHTVRQVVLPVARNGILTGALLVVARVAGETAPLLMVTCSYDYWNLNPHNPIATLPVEIYNLRSQPSPHAQAQAWGVALMLVILVLAASLLARIFTYRYAKSTS